MRTVTYDENWVIEIGLTFGIHPDSALAFARELQANPAHPATAGDAEDAARLDRMESALDQIQAWASAYPIGMFPEPDWAASAKVLKAAGLSLDAISAANMRHVITRVQEIADNAMCASIGGE